MLKFSIVLKAIKKLVIDLMKADYSEMPTVPFLPYLSRFFTMNTAVRFLYVLLRFFNFFNFFFFFFFNFFFFSDVFLNSWSWALCRKCIMHLRIQTMHAEWWYGPKTAHIANNPHVMYARRASIRVCIHGTAVFFKLLDWAIC